MLLHQREPHQRTPKPVSYTHLDVYKRQTHTFDQKLAAIKAAQAAGLTVCSGGIVGMGEDVYKRQDHHKEQDADDHDDQKKAGAAALVLLGTLPDIFHI